MESTGINNLRKSEERMNVAEWTKPNQTEVSLICLSEWYLILKEKKEWNQLKTEWEMMFEIGVIQPENERVVEWISLLNEWYLIPERKNDAGECRD